MSKHSFWFRFLNSGYDEPIYKDFRPEIALQNKRMVETTSTIGCIIMLALTLTACFVQSVSRVLPLYFVTALLFAACYLVAHFFGAKDYRITLLCNYGFLLAAFFFALGLDTIQRNDTATTVCVLLVALPLLIVDRPFREFPFFLAVSVCFMCESVFIKQSPKASIDVLNAIAFFVVGSFLGYKHNQMVLRNLRGQRLLEQQRDTDALTNLYNKSALETKASAFLAQPNVKASLIILDMDNFKFVNDTYGHHAGDELLTKLGSLLTSVFRAGDLLCRFGGDEFIIFLPMIDKRASLAARAEQILDGVSQIRLRADEEYRAHVCIGIAVYPGDGNGYEELFKSADAAMYHVKQNGKNGYSFCGAPIKPKVLVVDDIEMNRALLIKTLSRDYQMLEAADGEDAIEVLRAFPDIALVITDLQMPGMDGETLIRKMRSDHAFDDIAIIASTQHGDPKQEEQMIKLGVNDFVYKAASPGVIQLRVKNALRIRESQ